MMTEHALYTQTLTAERDVNAPTEQISTITDVTLSPEAKIPEPEKTKTETEDGETIVRGTDSYEEAVHGTSLDELREQRRLAHIELLTGEARDLAA